MTHPQAMEFSGVQKYLLWTQQHNIEFEKDKRSGCPKEITGGRRNIFMCADGEGEGDRVSVSTLSYLQFVRGG